MSAFDVAFDLLKTPLVYHLTDDPNFTLDPNYEPEDNAIAIQDRSGKKGIYTTGKDMREVERWLNGYGYWRPYVAELAIDDETYGRAGGRWGGERFIPASAFDEMSVRRVLPLDIIAREAFGGSTGWIADETGRTFDGVPTPKGLYPFRGMDFGHIDTRTMSPKQIEDYESTFNEFMGLRGYNQ